MSLKKKLMRMKTHLPEEKEAGPDVYESAEDKSALSNIGFYPFYLEDGRSYRRKIVYEWSDPSLYERMKKLESFWQGDSEVHPLQFKQPVEKLLFFDTETTGLSTGAGTVIFLIGYARVNPLGIEVTQHFLPGPENEAAFLGGFLEDFEEDDILVSYNGKSFDWPQVRSRHAFLRRELPKLPETGHIDLLHAARRFWKEELPSCRLSIVEAEKLGQKRTGDTPGSLAPLLYFDYLQSDDPAPLQGIIDHHDQDVRSLVQLYTLLAEKLTAESTHTSPQEHEAAAHWWESLKQFKKAEWHWLEAERKAEKPSQQRIYRLALNKRKQKKPEEAVVLLERVRKNHYPLPEAMEELAKLYEHYYKNISESLIVTEEGLRLETDVQIKAKLNKRHARLRKKGDKL
ncbi:ribonuclease H-like domain-containing protein [Alkalicoccus halolimnae]|uniref:Ribonuclease H-like domain-containing protein n=1 Tax=Alkalicoccus halolimnae TaxID=1667239 RepID=A0A5C7FPH4_9BACI|nr:ribonuclease H-like domain-containing protein [Alkalicoccus halolimnae]TXF87266.1 hypothetical protein FTX54_00650 [Alkalicoccus halolimnae]